MDTSRRRSRFGPKKSITSSGSSSKIDIGWPVFKLTIEVIRFLSNLIFTGTPSLYLDGTLKS
jgi:hypothetical protein